MSEQIPFQNLQSYSNNGWVTDGDVPEDFNPQSNVKSGTDSDTNYTAYTFSFGGEAPFFKNIFSASLSTLIPLDKKVVSISVSSDDNASVSVDGIGSVSSTLNNPRSNSFFKEDGTNYTGTFPLSITYNTIGGPWFLNVTIRVSDNLPPPIKQECDCKSGSCGMSTSVDSGSVDFSQPFGRVVSSPGFPAGKLKIYDRIPVSKLFSGAGLRYLHPMSRRVKAIYGASVVIVDDFETEYNYINGRPAGTAVWTDRQVKILPNGTVVEILEDRTEITFGADGNAVSIKSPGGISLATNALGIEIIRDSAEKILQVFSQVDGLMNVVSLSAMKFRVDWYKPADVGVKGLDGLYAFTGTPVKKFHFGDVDGDGSCAIFELLEERPAGNLQFHYSWKYDDSKRDWLFVRGNGGPATVKSTKEKIFSNDGKTAQIKEWRQVGSGQKKLYSTETYDCGDDGEMLILRVVDGIEEYSATRVATGNGKGKIATETDKHGNTISYLYDEYGRTLSETKSKGFAGLEEKIEYTYVSVPAGSDADLRPRSVVQKIAGTVFKSETFSYNDDATAGRVETRSATVAGTTLTDETRYYPSTLADCAAGRVKLEIRADGTATFYEYEALANSGYTQTETFGIFENETFSIVPAKSTRAVYTIDALGNEIRAENFVHTGTEFVSIYWITKTYSPTHKVVSTLDSAGKTTSADYICTGPVWTVDADGVRTENVYNQAKQILTSTRKGARGDVITRYTYDAEGRAISEVKTSGALSQTTSRTFNLDGSLASETDALGNITSYARVLNNDGTQTDTVTHSDTGTQITLSSADGSTISITGTAVVPQFYVYEFDAERGLKVTTIFTGALNSARWAKTYVDGLGRVVKTERPGFGENVILSVGNTYNAKNQLTQIVATGEPNTNYVYDPLGNQIETQTSISENLWRKTATELIYEKDSAGVVWKKATQIVSCSDTAIAPLTTVDKTQLSGLSLLLESKQISIDVRGNTTVKTSSYNLETKTRTQITTFPHCTGTQTTISVDGVIVSQVSPGNVSVSATYDAFNRKLSETDSRGNVTEFLYDANNQILSEIKSLNSQQITINSYSYDSMGRRTRVTYADETFIATAYDLRGNAVAEYGNASYPQVSEFDIFNQRTSLQTFRTLAGTPEELVNLTDGDATTWSFDEATGLLLSKIDADEKSVVYTYTQNCLLVYRAWSRGVTTSYAYDAWKQLVSVNYSDNTANVAHVYDALGRNISTTDAAGTTSFVYSEYGEMVLETVSGLNNKTIAYHFDSFGRDVGYSIDGTRKTTLSYNATTGEISSVNSDGRNWSWSYFSGTHLKQQLVAPNNLTTDYTYDADRDLLASVTNSRAGTVFSKYDYEYDANGRVTSMSKSGTMMKDGNPSSVAYGYNSRSETISAVSNTDALYNFGYDFDNIGNRNSATESGAGTTYATNSLNQYTSITGTTPPASFTPTFDADGNQTLVKTSTGTWQVSYNGENRPVVWKNFATNTVLEMIYDSRGRRISYRVLKNGAQTTFTRFFYKGYTLVQQLYSNSPYNIYKEFVWDPTEPVATKPLFMKHDTYNMLYTHDGNKNVSEVMFANPINGIGAHYEYAPFGAIARTSKSTPISSVDFIELNPFRFSSELHDQELGLVYYNYRHYNPTDGRWLSRDPIAEQGGLNLYWNCSNNLIDRYDRLGFVFFCQAQKKIFLEWYEMEKDISWVDDLDPCPLKLKRVCIVPARTELIPSLTMSPTLIYHDAVYEYENPDPTKWEMSKKGGWNGLTFGFHSGGDYELRSKKPSKTGAGNQCIYDSCGRLMTNIPTAGTADKSSPSGPNDSHFSVDVYYYLIAEMLDLCCLGKNDDPMKYVKLYYEVRPQHN